MLNLFRHAALRPEIRSRRRTAIARAPRFESLEERKLPAILVLPSTSVPVFTATLIVPAVGGFNEYFGVPLSGGNFLGTYHTTALSSSYSVSLQRGTLEPSIYYSASETSNATIYGTVVPNAGGIAWLLAHYGPTATTALQQDALQAAIWRTEYGTVFELDGVDNPAPISPSSVNAMIGPTYQAELAALGNKTLPLSDVIWITPDSVATLDVAREPGLVALGPIPKTAITSSVTSAAVGQAVTFGAAVTNTSTHGGTPTGSVQFQVDGTNFGDPVPLSASGTANLVETGLGVGSHRIDAVYIPSGDLVASTSPNYTQTITPDVTAVFVRSSANPSKKGKAVNFSVTVANESPLSTAIPLGTVVFKIDGQTKASVGLSGGKAVLKGLKLAVGTHTVTVFYTPLNANYAASQGQLIGGETVHT